MARVLVIDDDLMICEMVADIVEDLGHRCDTARTLKDGLARARAGRYDVVFQDVYLADGTGLDVLGELKGSPGRPEVVVITGSGEPLVAERAMREGAWDFVAKPLDLSSITGPLERALKYRQEHAARAPERAIRREGIAGSGPLMRAMLHTVALAGESGASVLITGETGTGKELFARAIHANSPRAKKPFVVVDCASLPETLVESTLFGHVKGAFTGADKAREGLVKLADGGTLFLDEVGELPFSMQRAFLRVLEEHTFRPVGSKAEEHSDFRLVAATNRHLEAMVEQGEFRRDLLYRIRSFSLELPPLRERPEDIEEIVRSHMERLAGQGRFEVKDVSPEFHQALRAYPWPGNVRELVQCLERALAASQAETTLFLAHLPDDIRVNYARTLVTRGEEQAPRPVPLEPAPPRAEPSPAPLAEPPATPAFAPAPPGPGPAESWSEYREQAVSRAERDYFQALIAAENGNVKRCCSVAGVSRARLYQIMQKHGLTRPR